MYGCCTYGLNWRDIEITANEIMFLKQKLNKILSDNTYGNVTYEDMVKMTDRDNWMSPEQAIQYGLIDKII